MRNPNERTCFEINKLNPFWKDFHFFYRQVSKTFITEELICNYTHHFKDISIRMKQDFSSTPVTLVSNGFMWNVYDLRTKRGFNKGK